MKLLVQEIHEEEQLTSRLNGCSWNESSDQTQFLSLVWHQYFNVKWQFLFNIDHEFFMVEDW